ncbi:hypothetical protein FEM48_Zijuj06G0122000 [Ziziphus jujuba var. spinosa]|uniref:Uncharacterized protein n=1 Tax=Ziziphus jujuba var. spinosa TaxID=714518 RepID=A0A978V978_ZIZJJ|nr:hypothetical protein FEM48_Zijuj06G0122000 [Ziziphus jujuba var. spinosa]
MIIQKTGNGTDNTVSAFELEQSNLLRYKLRVECLEVTRKLALQLSTASFSNKGNQALMERAEEALKASIQRQFGRHFEPTRQIPGGPDPYHH